MVGTQGPLITIEDLPDEALGCVLSLVGRTNRASASAVCKRWRRLAFAEPALWSPFTARAEHHPDAEERHLWLAAKRTQLARVASAVTAAEVTGFSAQGPEAGELGSLLLQLSPGVLTSLRLERQPSLPAAALNILAALSRLTSLRLASEQLPANTADALAALHCLQRLSCTTASQGRLGEALARLPPLEHLEVNTGEDLLLPRLAEAIRKHSGLGSLVLDAGADKLDRTAAQAGEVTAVLLSCLRGLTQLTRLQLTISSGPVPALAPMLAELPSLLHFSFLARAGQLPEPSEIAQRLETCQYFATNKFQVGPFQLGKCRISGSGASIHAERLALEAAAPLGHLLSSLLPPDNPQPLRSLTLRQCSLGSSAAAVVSPAMLRSLTALHLTSVSCMGNSNIASMLSMLAEQAPALQEVDLCDCPMAALPALAGCPGLHTLRVRDCRLGELEKGSYLSGLTELDLSGSVFLCLPPVLAAATALRTLRADFNRHLAAVADFDPHAVLAHMEQLEWLSLRGNRLLELPRSVRCLSRLRRLDFGRNSLEELPEGLAGATSLTCLMLDGNPRLAVTQEGADGILLSLPRLFQLDLAGTATPDAVREHLLAAGPRWLDPAGLPLEGVGEEGAGGGAVSRRGPSYNMAVSGYEPRW